MQANQDLLIAQLFGNESLPTNFGLPVQETQEMLGKSMLSRMHQHIYQHLMNCNMQKTAAAFLEESKYFPHFKGTLENIPQDMLIRLWSLMTFSNPNVFKEMQSFSYTEQQVQQVFIPPQVSPIPVEVKLEPMFSEDSSFVHIEKKVEIDEKKNQLQRTIFQCRQPGCSSSFSTMANMKRHEKLHSGEKPFICPAENCAKKFARKYDMKIHMRIHTKEKPYLCNICDKRFSRISSLREHERNLHQLDISSKRRRFEGEDVQEEEDDDFSPAQPSFPEQPCLPDEPTLTFSPSLNLSLNRSINGLDIPLNRSINGLGISLNRSINGLDIPLNRSVDGLDIPPNLVPLPNFEDILCGLPTSPLDK